MVTFSIFLFLIKQTIGHRKSDTSSTYVKDLSDLERQE